MSQSLRDQLAQAGMVTKQQAKKAKTLVKKNKKKANKTGELTEQQRRQIELEKKNKEQIKRDRQLNHIIENERQQKAIQAQVKQLIENHTIDRGKGDVSYNFVVDNKVKTIYIEKEMQELLSRGLYAIGRLQNTQKEDVFYILPAPVANKIRERSPESIIMHDLLNQELTEEEKDWYKDFEIPDDLDW